MRLWDLGVMRRESHCGGAASRVGARAVAEGAGAGPPSPGSCSRWLRLLLWDVLGSEDFGSQKQRGELSLAGVLGKRAPFWGSFS